MEHLIEFPDLGISLEISRVAFSIFGHDIYWYGVIIGIGFLIAMFYITARSKSFSLRDDDSIDLLMIATPLAIIGARIYYVAFEWESYRDKGFIAMIAIWEGGLAIYGGIIASIIVVILFCKKRKLRLGNMLDVGSLGLLIGQSIGRWGNFVNAEAFGSETNLPWRMVIDNASYGVHPTFFYESFWNFIGLIILHIYSKKRKFAGEVFLLYITWYGAGRAWIEGLRTDSLYIGNTGIRASQLLAIISVLVALSLIFIMRKKLKKTKLSFNWSIEEEAPTKAPQAKASTPTAKGRTTTATSRQTTTRSRSNNNTGYKNKK